MLHWPAIWAAVIGLLILWGAGAHLERYITPQRGLGYWLGITGGSMMILLLLYSARKRVRWLRWMGGIPQWFQFHMVLGVAGPVLVLFHANFRLGATNSNVALVSMLLVAGSGVVGRYIYTRIHAHLDGRQDSLQDLQAAAARIRAQTSELEFLQGVFDAIESEERRLANPASGNVMPGTVRVLTGGWRAAWARRRLHRLIHQTVATARAQAPEPVAWQTQRIVAVACGYADRRLDASRRIAEYRLYARLFSLWHVLHLPLFFLLLLAGVAHVVAVNVY